MGVQQLFVPGKGCALGGWTPSIVFIPEAIMREPQRNIRPEAPVPVRSLPSTRGAMFGWGGVPQMQREMQEVLRRERNRVCSAAALARR